MLLSPITARAGKLHDAAEKGDTKKVTQLIQQGEDVDSRGFYESTALMWAAIGGVWGAPGGHIEVVELLLAAKANVNAKSKRGYTALMGAAWRGNTEVVKLLLAANADVNAKSDRGTTALITAAYRDKIEVVKLLLAANADVNAMPTDGKFKGKTALGLAKDTGNLELAKLIEEAGGK